MSAAHKTIHSLDWQLLKNIFDLLPGGQDQKKTLRAVRSLWRDVVDSELTEVACNNGDPAETLRALSRRLPNMPNVTTLELRFGASVYLDASVLSKALEDSALEHLTLCGVTLTPGLARCLVTHCASALQWLTLTRCIFESTNTIEAFAGVPWTSLVRLSMQRCTIHDDEDLGDAIERFFRSMPHVTHCELPALDFRESAYAFRFYRHLAVALSRLPLEKLDYSDNHTTESWRFIYSMAGLSWDSLKVLNLDHTLADDRSVQQLCSSVSLPALEQLHMSSVHEDVVIAWNDETLRAVNWAMRRKWSRLKNVLIGLHDVANDDDYGEQFALLISGQEPFPCLESIAPGSDYTHPEVLSALATAAELKRLPSWTLLQFRLTMDLMDAVEPLFRVEWPGVKILSISTHDTISRHEDIMYAFLENKFPALRELILDEGLSHRFTAKLGDISLPHLQTLELRAASAQDVCSDVLREGPTAMPNLRFLTLGGSILQSQAAALKRAPWRDLQQIECSILATLSKSRPNTLNSSLHRLLL